MPYFVEGDEPQAMHELMAGALDKAIVEIQRVRTNARTAERLPISEQAHVCHTPRLHLRPPPKLMTGTTFMKAAI
jgi:phosphoketolase